MRIWFRYVLYLIVFIGNNSAHAGAYEDFFRAVKLDDGRSVSALLQRGFDPNSRDETGQIALFSAFREGALKVVEVLFQHPSIQIGVRNEAGETPLMMAALRGQREWVLRLLDRGLAVNQEGWTALHYAATGSDSTAVVELLLARGAAVDARSPNGSTPLMMAARYGSEASVDLLLARGANAGARNERNFNAADFARMVGRDSLAARLDAAAPR